MNSGNLLSGRRDSNPRPLAWKANALSAELLPHFSFEGQVIQPETFNLEL